MNNVKPKVIFLALNFIFSTLIVLLILDHHSIDAQQQFCPGKPGDYDGDDIPDSWERNEIYTKDGNKVNLDLPAHGAQYNHKDIFLEIDYLGNHKPNASSISKVIETFAKAPICNPDGNPGINLHVIIDDQIDETQDNKVIRIICENPPKKNWDGFNSLKEKYFGTKDERNDSDVSNILDLKELVYHYGIFIHQYTKIGSSGCADPNNLNFVVSHGGFKKILGVDAMTGDVASNIHYEAGTLMHELGHILGLGHGGNTSELKNNYKPNYLSVMNYNFQWPSPIGNRELDYSACAISPLNEQALNETKGIGTSCIPEAPGQQTWVGSHKTGNNNITLCEPNKAAKIDASFDWDSNSNINSTIPVSKDIDCDGKNNEILHGYDDWANIKYIYNSYISPADAEVDLAGQSITRENITEQLDIYDEKTVNDLLQERESGLQRVDNDISNFIIDDDIRNYYLSQLGLPNNASSITIPDNTTEVIVNNATGSFAVPNATGITFTNNTTTEVIVNNATGSFAVPNATDTTISGNTAREGIVNNASSITIPDNIAKVIVDNATGSFAVPNATGITFTNNTTTEIALSSPNVKDLLESNKPLEAIDKLSDLQITSDSASGGNSAGDLIENPEDGKLLMETVENFKSVLEKQGGLP